MLFVFDPGEKRFELLNVVGQSGFLLPSFVVLLVLTGGSGGSLGVAILGLILVIAFHLCPVLTTWFQEGEDGFDIVAGYALGLSRREILMNRILPKILRRSRARGRRGSSRSLHFSRRGDDRVIKQGRGQVGALGRRGFVVPVSLSPQQSRISARAGDLVGVKSIPRRVR